MIVLVLLTFAFGIWNLGSRELWFDEAVSTYVSGLGWVDTITYVRNAAWEHPPSYYLLLHAWQVLTGRSEFALRFFSLLWGVLCIPLLYVLVKRLSGERLGVLAALLATISPFMVAYAQEARMYTMLPCLALLALLAFWNGLEREHQPAWWLAYLALIMLGVMTHYYFVLIWVVTTLYLLLECLRSRRVHRQAFAAHGAFLLLVVVWLVSAPGLRESMTSVGETVTDFTPAYKLSRVMPTLMLAEAAVDRVPLVASFLAIGGWTLVLLGVWWSRRIHELDARVWLLLVLLLVVPLVVSLLLPWVKGRHLGFVLIPAFTFMALGLLALRRLGLAPVAVGILTILALVTYGLVAHYARSSGSFGQAMAYINGRGQPEDVLILPQPLQWPVVSHYNGEEWPVYYVPPTVRKPTAAMVQDVLSELARTHSRLWLGPAGAWTADPERLAEQWLVANAYQAGKVWFPDSSTVALYLTSRGGLDALEVGNWTWGGQIGLYGVEASPLRVHSGDALRLRFSWRARTSIDGRYEVSLRLVDDQGFVWAERRGEPCGGWCPTDEWQSTELVQDRHALVIPPGTPPGTYRLEVSWLPLDGGAFLQAELNVFRTDRVGLVDVKVLPNGSSQEPWDLPNPLQVTFGGEVKLLGYGPTSAEVRPGDSLLLDTHWRAEKEPSADLVLVMELVDENEEAAAESSSVVIPSYPTSSWQPGQYLRGQQRLHLPVSLTPGNYSLRVALVSPEGGPLEASGQAAKPARLQDGELVLATVEVLDRPRRFDLPPMTNAFKATVGKQAHLMGYDLELRQAQPGGQLAVTLYWRAGGPMVRPFKVFTHLLDSGGTIQAQHDSPPGGGCCPAHTWVEGEVIVDEHSIALGSDLLPGTYWLAAGMYDEEFDTRMPAYDATGKPFDHDRIVIGGLTIEAPPVEQDQVILPAREDLDWAAFLPLVCKGCSPR
jgi:uncharacterized membrane protein